MKITPYSKQDINKSDIASVIKTLKSDYLTSGPKVSKFENHIKKYVKSRYAVSANSATSALHMSCLALGVKKNDIVWTSSISFVASANSAIYCGANVDFLDIDLDTFNICTTKLREKLIKAKKNKILPKIIILVHLAGLSCKMKEIHKLSKKYKFKIIEDASHALGSTHNGLPVGSCKYSEIAVFSFHPVKIATTCEGGIATTNSKEIQEKLKIFREHGLVRNSSAFEKKKASPFYYEQQMLGYNYRLSDIHASLGISQLKRVKKFIKKRNLIRRMYEKSFNKLPIKFQKIDKSDYSSHHLVIISVQKNIRNRLIKFLLKKKIKTNIHYIPIFYHPFHFKKKFFKNVNSIKYYDTSLSIPNYYGLSLKNVNDIIKNIKYFFDKI